MIKIRMKSKGKEEQGEGKKGRKKKGEGRVKGKQRQLSLICEPCIRTNSKPTRLSTYVDDAFYFSRRQYSIPLSAMPFI